MQCRNCSEPTHVPDNCTGLIHKNNKYICRTKSKGKVTAAE